MKPITEYECEVCHTRFSNENDATSCEQSHSKIEKIKDTRYFAKTQYPNKIEIKFADGTTKWYKKCEV